MEGTSWRRSRLPSILCFTEAQTLTNRQAMKSLAKLFPVLGLVLGASLAMAMNFATPSIDSSLKVWTPDATEPDGYRDVTAIVQQNDYQCNQSTMECLVQFSNDDPSSGTPNILSQGIFVEL